MHRTKKELKIDLENALNQRDNAYKQLDNQSKAIRDIIEYIKENYDDVHIYDKISKMLEDKKAFEMKLEMERTFYLKGDNND